MKNSASVGVLLTLGVLTIAGCGGGGGGASTGASNSNSGGATFTGVSLNGTAATGAAIAGKAVSAKCANDTTGSATTGSDGVYTIAVSGASLPCMLEVTAADGTILHTLADGSGNGSATANLTPFTELIVAKALGGATTPSDVFAAFSSSTKGVITTDGLSAAKTAVVASLKASAGVDLTGIDPLKDKFAVGDNADKKLDVLKALMTTAKVSLEELANTLIASKPENGDTASLVQVLAPPPLASCPSLRNGSFVSISHTGYVAEHVIDYKTKVVVNPATQVTGTIIDNGSCSFTITYPDNTTSAVFSPNGVGIFRSVYPAYNETRIGVIFPKQSLTIADTAGTWAGVGFDRDNSNSRLYFGGGVSVIGADGSYSMNPCNESAAPAGSVVPNFVCNDPAHVSTGKLTVDSSGRMIDSSDSSVGYAFRAADGTVMGVFGVPNSSGIRIYTQQKAMSLPAVGKVSNFWDVWGSQAVANGVFSSNAITDKTVTVKSVDAKANSFTRDDGKTFYINVPGSGARYRPAGVDASGATYSASVQLRVGSFLTVNGGATGANWFGLSLTHP